MTNGRMPESGPARLLFVAVSACLLLGTHTALAQRTAPRLSASTGLDYTSGKYGSATSTEITSIPVAGKLELGSWTFAVSVPYIRIKGPGDVVGGTDTPIVTKKGKQRGVTAASENSGLGDIIGAVSFALPTGPAMPSMELTGKVKFPTADATKNLGTGEFDYTFLVEAWQRFGPIIPYGSIGYRFIGDPSGVDLNNQVLVGVGASFDMGRQLVGGLALDYRSSTSDQADDPLELTPYIVWKMASVFKVNVYGLVGLSSGSADYGFGVKLILSP